MVYFADFRENAMAAIDTQYTLTEKGADSPGAINVGQGVSRLTDVRIAFGAISTDVITGTTMAIKIAGTGLRSSGDVYLVGPMLSVAGAAATDGGFAVAQPMHYKTNIPVQVGEINIYAYCHGEDPGTAHALVHLEFDGFPGKIRGGDYREESTGAAANTFVSLRLRETAAAGDFLPVGRTIGEVIFGAAPDPVGHATDGLLIAPSLKLSGEGLLTNTLLEYVGNCGSQHPDTDVVGTGAIMQLPTRYVVPGIKTKATGRIQAEAQNIESIEAIHAICGLCYI